MSSRIKRMIQGRLKPLGGIQMPKGKGYGQSSRVNKPKNPKTTGKAKSGPKVGRPGRKTTK